MIGCAFDGSAEARHALRYAAELAPRLGAEIQIIGVHQPVSFGLSVSGTLGYRSANAALRDALQTKLDGARDPLDSGAGATTLLLEGPVAATLIGQSAELDLLVAGSRGYGPVRRVLVGSVSRALVRDASCPIVVVPRPGETEVGAAS